MLSTGTGALRRGVYLNALLVILAAGACAPCAAAGVIKWNAAATGKWDAGGSWAGGTEPGADDEAQVLVDGAAFDVNFKGGPLNRTVKSFTLGSKDATFVGDDGNMNLKAGEGADGVVFSKGKVKLNKFRFLQDAEPTPVIKNSVEMEITGICSFNPVFKNLAGKVTLGGGADTTLTCTSPVENSKDIILTSTANKPTKLDLTGEGDKKVFANKAGATLSFEKGAGGVRTFGGTVKNEGTIKFSALTTNWFPKDAVHINKNSFEFSANAKLVIPAPTAAGAIVIDNTGGTIAGDKTNRINANGGKVKGGKIEGKIDVPTAGRGVILTEPATLPGLPGIDGDYSADLESDISFGIGGRSAGEFDTFDVSGVYLRAGLLRVNLVDLGNGFVPEAGDVFPIVTAGTLSGMFNAVVLPSFPGIVFSLDDSSVPGSLLVRADSVPTPGAVSLLLAGGVLTLRRRGR